MKLQISFMTAMILVATVSALAFHAQKQSHSTKNVEYRLLKNWNAKPVSKIPKDFWEYKTDNAVDWKVSLIKGEPVASKVDYNEKNVSPVPFEITNPNRMARMGRIVALKVEDGLLIGRDAGEWGGDLYWRSDDGKQSYEISGQQILGFLKSKETIFAITGLTHLSLDQGEVLTVSQKTNEHWKTETFRMMKSAPKAIVEGENGSLWVLAYRALTNISSRKNQNDLVEFPMPGRYLYPNSMVKTANGDLYMGMRLGVARLRKGSSFKSMEFLTPK